MTTPVNFIGIRPSIVQLNHAYQVTVNIYLEVIRKLYLSTSRLLSLLDLDRCFSSPFGFIMLIYEVDFST
jgi:hypothetical protein